MSPEPDPQRADRGTATEQPAPPRGINGGSSSNRVSWPPQGSESSGGATTTSAAPSPEASGPPADAAQADGGEASSGDGAPRSTAVPQAAGEEPGVSASDRGGPAAWIDAPVGMARSGKGVSKADRRLARGLGWFSLGLGIPQVLVPGRVCKLAGLESTFVKRQVMRMVGLREIGAGVGIFSSQPTPAEWLWARVAGDLMDLAMFQAAFSNPFNRKGRLVLATANVMGVTALDVQAARKHGQALKEAGEEFSLKGRTAITVNRSPEEVYRYWHDFQNLPRFMFHLEAVEPRGDRRYHWVAKAPLGQKVEWDAEVVEDVSNELIAWRATEDADVPNSGSVRFVPAPGGRGTEVIVEIDYQLPGGAIGDTVARLFGEEPQQQMKDDLRRFKQVVETGEVVRSEGSPEGTYALNQIKWRPAQPLP